MFTIFVHFMKSVSPRAERLLFLLKPQEMVPPALFLPAETPSVSSFFAKNRLCNALFPPSRTVIFCAFSALVMEQYLPLFFVLFLLLPRPCLILPPALVGL